MMIDESPVAGRPKERSMSAGAGVRASLALLSLRSRLVLWVVAGVQMASSLLDLAGVLLIGLVTALALSGVGGSGGSRSLTTPVTLPFVPQSPSDSFILWLACVAGALLVLKSLINIYLTRFTLSFLARRQAEVSAELTAKLMSTSILEIQGRSSQETAYALTTGVNFATLMVLGQAEVAATEAVLLALLTSGLFLVSPVITLFAVAFFSLVAFFLHRFLSLRAGRLGAISSSVEVSSYAAIQEALASYREIVVGDRRSYYVDFIRRCRWQAAKVQADLSLVGLIPKYVLDVALVVGGGLLVASQILTKDMASALAVIALFLVAGSRVLPSILRLQGAFLVMRSAAGQALPTYAIAAELKTACAPGSNSTSVIERLPSEPREFRPFDPRVEVDQVTFAYPGSPRPAVSQVSFSLESGAALAIAGPTGSGKSTLADLVLGVLSPDSGSIRIGGVEPSQAVSGWPGCIGYVPQHVALTNGTVRNNVALGLPSDEIDDESVWAALEDARLADFLVAHRQGLDTPVGEGGVRLSGGQRQRLGLARALYSRPIMLVLDEATSALDAQTEHAIGETLQGVHGRVTTIVIAHRLATLKSSDLILYIDDGGVAGRGTFEELRRTSQAFDQQANLLGL